MPAFDKNTLEEVRVEPTHYNGKQYVSARVFWRHDQASEWLPSRKGLCLRPELAKEVAAAMAQTAKGLLKAEKAGEAGEAASGGATIDL